MAGLLTRRLLRDWKYLYRHYHHTENEDKVLFHLKPQDSNLHVWHLVMEEPLNGLELYMRLFIGNEDEPTVILRCLTPNMRFPINRNISLTHLNYLLIDSGFLPLLQHIWKLFFEGVQSNFKSERDSRFCLAWNRIICRDFKLVFPELLGTLAPGDYEMVKGYSRKNQHIFQHDIQPSYGVSNAGIKDVLPQDYDKDNLLACDERFMPAENALVKRRWSRDDDSTDCEQSSTNKRVRK